MFLTTRMMRVKRVVVSFFFFFFFAAMRAAVFCARGCRARARPTRGFAKSARLTSNDSIRLWPAARDRTRTMRGTVDRKRSFGNRSRGEDARRMYTRAIDRRTTGRRRAEAFNY